MTNVWPNGSLTIPRVTAEMGWYDPFGTGQMKRHNGIDLVGFDEIKSPVDGVVTFSGYNGTAGNEVRLRENGTGDVVRLLHNRAVNVRAEQAVRQGQVVAWMGSTGQSTGPHCHEEIRPGGGEPINPRDWYARRNASVASGGAKPFEPPKEDAMTVAVVLNNRHYYIVGEEFISHNGTMEQATITRQVISTTDELHRLGTVGFLDLLDGLGIPRSVVHLGNGWVVNPQSGQYEANGVWSRRREAVALLGEQRNAFAALREQVLALSKPEEK